MSYELWIDLPALRQAKELPGHVRQRIRRAIDDLSTDPCPSQSRLLRIPDAPIDIRRLTIEHWRVIYGVGPADGWVWVLAVHRRPPYNYEDMPQLLARLRELRG